MSTLYVGGYQEADAFCLYCVEYSGGALRVSASYEVRDASYLCLSPNGKFLYAVIETAQFTGRDGEGMRDGGGVAAFAVEGGGKLRFINDAPTEGAHPCHLSVSADGRTLYVANYTGGSCVLFGLSDDGGIGARKLLVKHSDFGSPSGVVAGRQDNPHAHFITPGKFGAGEALWVCDLGLDAVLVLDENGRELSRLDLPGGFGPRHMAFHPALPVVYVVGEMGQAVVAVDLSDASNGIARLKASKPVNVSPDAKVSCAAIRVSPDGRFLLVSNRGARGNGADSLAVLRLDDAGGIAGLYDVYKTRGRCPRDFTFTPDGREVLAAYQDSDFIEVLNWADGVLAPEDVELAVQKPTCVVFV